MSKTLGSIKKEKKIAGFSSIGLAVNDKQLGMFNFDLSYKGLDGGFKTKKVDAEGKQVKGKYVQTGEGSKVLKHFNEDGVEVDQYVSVVEDTFTGKQVKSLGTRLIKFVKITDKSITADFLEEKTIKMWSKDPDSFRLAASLGEDKCIVVHFQPNAKGLLYVGLVYPKTVKDEGKYKLIWICKCVLRRLDCKDLYPEAQEMTSTKEYEQKLEMATSLLDAVGV